MYKYGGKHGCDRIKDDLYVINLLEDFDEFYLD